MRHVHDHVRSVGPWYECSLRHSGLERMFQPAWPVAHLMPVVVGIIIYDEELVNSEQRRIDLDDSINVAGNAPCGPQKPPHMLSLCHTKLIFRWDGAFALSKPLNSIMAWPPELHRAVFRQA